MSNISKLAMLAASAAEEVIEHVAYVGIYADNQIVALNITDPSNVTVLATQTLNTVSDTYLDAPNDILYALSLVQRRVYAYDISDPKSFTLLSYVQVDTNGFENKSIAYDPVQELIITSRATIVDASNPSSLSVAYTGNRTEFTQVSYIKEGSDGKGMFAAVRPTFSRIDIWAFNSNSFDNKGSYSYTGVNGSFAVDPTIATARDGLVFGLSGSQENIKALRPNPVGTGASGFDLRSSATNNLDGVVTAAAYPSQRKVYVADRDNDNYLVTFSYDGNGGSLTYQSRQGNFQEPSDMYVNDAQALLAVTHFGTFGARINIYSLSSPNTPSQTISYTLTTTTSNHDYMPVAIHHYPQT